MNKDNGMLWSCMCSLIEILWVLEEKISLNCWQVQHDVPVTEIFEFNLHVNFLYFLWNWVNLLGIFTTCEKLRAFERNQNLKKQLSDVLETNSLTLMSVEIFFWNFSVANMAENRTQCKLQTMI